MLISLNAISLDYDYTVYKKNPSLFNDYLYGLESGMGWYDSTNRVTNAKQFYCQPSNLALGLDTIKNIIDGQVKEFSNNGWTNEEIDESPIGMILLVGLSSTFPCNE
jgi:hypothetical protein